MNSLRHFSVMLRKYVAIKASSLNNRLHVVSQVLRPSLHMNVVMFWRLFHERWAKMKHLEGENSSSLHCNCYGKESPFQGHFMVKLFTLFGRVALLQNIVFLLMSLNCALRKNCFVVIVNCFDYFTWYCVVSFLWTVWREIVGSLCTEWADRVQHSYSSSTHTAVLNFYPLCKNPSLSLTHTAVLNLVRLSAL